MAIIFDPEKSELNRRFRGLPFTMVDAFDWNHALVFEDDREDYGEPRFVAIGRIGRTLYVVVFTPIGDDTRVISLRAAEKYERELFHAR